MAIIAPTGQTATTVQTVHISLKDSLAAGESPAAQTMNYSLVVLDQNGRRVRWQHEQGKLRPHLSPTQETLVEDFLTLMRTLAEGVLP